MADNWQARHALEALRQLFRVVEVFEERVGDRGLNIDVLVARNDMRGR